MDAAPLWTAAFKAGSGLARTVPAPVAAGAARALGLAFAPAMASKRAMVARHMRRVLGPGASPFAVRRAVQQAFDSYARYWVESFRLPMLPAAEVDAGMSVTGYGLVVEALRGGNGCILALPHLGGWEWAGRWVADLGHPITVVVEALHPPELFEWFVGLRASLGMTVVPLGPEAGPACLRALRRNEVLCLLSDRDIGGGGIEVEFFGERTRLPAGPATLGLRTGAPVFPTAVYFQGRGGHRGVVRPAVAAGRTGRLRDDVAAMTQRLAVELESLIRAAPEQWHLFSPNWPSDPGYSGS